MPKIKKGTTIVKTPAAPSPVQSPWGQPKVTKPGKG
jgi:hypothetical protein